MPSSLMRVTRELVFLAPPPNTVAVVSQLLSHVQLFASPWLAAHQASLALTISPSLLKLMSIESMMPANFLILCCPLLSPNTESSHPYKWKFLLQINCVCFVFSCSLMLDCLQPHGLQHARLPCPSLSPRVCSNSCPLSG